MVKKTMVGDDVVPFRHDVNHLVARTNLAQPLCNLYRIGHPPRTLQPFAAATISLLLLSPLPAASAEILQFQIYCLNNPTECPRTGPTVIKWSPKVVADLRRIDLRVNGSIIPRDEAPGQDEWLADVRYGDCDDYVMTKRRALIRLGYPPRALRPRILKINGAGHAVLDVYTRANKYTLDNLEEMK